MEYFTLGEGIFSPIQWASLFILVICYISIQWASLYILVICYISIQSGMHKPLSPVSLSSKPTYSPILVLKLCIWEPAYVG